MTTETNYNDGKCHGWDGGECPVHPKSEVEIVYTSPQATSGFFNCEGPAYMYRWEHDGAHKAIAFRVTKQYVEPPKPIEIWVNVCGDGSFGAPHNTKEKAIITGSDYKQFRTIRFREVVEETEPTQTEINAELLSELERALREFDSNTDWRMTAQKAINNAKGHQR